MVRVIFAGTPDFAVPSLRAMVVGGYEPQLVLTQPDRPAGRGQEPQPPPVKRLAVECGLAVAQPLRLDEVRDQLEQLKPELMVVVAYAHKVPYWLLTLPPMGVLNVHASLLPNYRGASPVAAALLNGDGEAGVSIMRLAEGWDTGPVFRQRAIAIEPDDNAGTLTDRLAELGAELLIEVLDLRVKGMITAKPQDQSKATYAPRLTKEDGRIDWSKPAEQLAREVRAYTPWPGSYTYWNGKMLKVLDARPKAIGHRPTAEAEPGRVLGDFAVETGDGVLSLRRMQLEGRKPMSAEEFLRGQTSIVGSVLG
jgi:methionyl-tRNA formyltransferase